jgi:alcohol dehydrogenase class IV
VLRSNGAVVGELYARLVEAEPDRAGEVLARRVEAHRELGGLPGRLRELGIPEAGLAELAALAAQQWTAGYNPWPLSEGDLLRLYEAAY